ncbi:unnamed protein product, partial [Oppiella nova]
MRYMAPEVSLLNRGTSTQFRSAIPKRASSSISRNTESNVSTGIRHMICRLAFLFSILNNICNQCHHVTTVTF